MGPVRQNPIQRTVRTAHLSVLMTVHNFQYTIQHRTVLISPLLPPDNHHSSDVVYERRGATDNNNRPITHWVVGYLAENAYTVTTTSLNSFLRV